MTSIEQQNGIHPDESQPNEPENLSSVSSTLIKWLECNQNSQETISVFGEPNITPIDELMNSIRLIPHQESPELDDPVQVSKFAINAVREVEKLASDRTDEYSFAAKAAIAVMGVSVERALPSRNSYKAVSISAVLDFGRALETPVYGRRGLTVSLISERSQAYITSDHKQVEKSVVKKGVDLMHASFYSLAKAVIQDPNRPDNIPVPNSY